MYFELRPVYTLNYETICAQLIFYIFFFLNLAFGYWIYLIRKCH